MVFSGGHIFRISIANDYVAHRAAAAGRWWRWQELAALPVGVIAMIGMTFGLAAEPWLTSCRPVSTLPTLVGSILLLVAADLLLEPRAAWSRSRDNAAMNCVCLAAPATLLLCIATSGTLAWPLLYPLLTLPLALVVPAALAVGVVSHLPLDEPTRRALVAGCLIVATLLFLAGGMPFQDQVACRWASSPSG